MAHRYLSALILLSFVCCASAFAQDLDAREPADLSVELRSASGSNRFQLGQVIPLEVMISSSTPNRYLEPCKLFWESCFGYPQCRFFTEWSFDVVPTTGWTDIGWHGCMAMSGPTTNVVSSDLTPEPKKYAYPLSNRFRFDAPGTYTVRFSLSFGLDDETNRIHDSEAPRTESHSVHKTAELTLEIVPAGDAWKERVVQEGMAAWTATPPPFTEPVSREYLENQKEKDALCHLGTPEAAVTLANLLASGINVTACVKINPHRDVAEAEMRRLLVDPQIGVRPVFFAAYAKLLSPSAKTPDDIAGVPLSIVDEVHDTLFRSLSKKTPDAMIPSLETVLRNPMIGYWVQAGSVYDLRNPYSDEVIALTAANFDRLSPETKAALLDADWDHVRSPSMLHVVRHKAEAGDGHALLRWLELDPASAIPFVHEEIIRPNPRFSALYLRLPEKSLPAQEQQIAANFVSLRSVDELIRSATLLHRYATRASFPGVLPFIDQHLSEWPCELQVPVLAYLLKVSPEDAARRVEQVLQKVSSPYCPRGEFFPTLGHVQASAVLDTLAAKQVEDGTPLAAEAAKYLADYGGANMKPVVWAQLARWRKKYVESGAEVRIANQKSTQDDWQIYNLTERLRTACINARAWTLSPQDAESLSKLLGQKAMEDFACTFSCGSRMSVGPSPGNFYIYGRHNDPVFPPSDRIEYVMPAEPYHYSVNQYRCPDLKALKEKLLQFPAGSTFSVAHTGDPSDGQGDWTEIKTFLEGHGYSFKN